MKAKTLTSKIDMFSVPPKLKSKCERARSPSQLVEAPARVEALELQLLHVRTRAALVRRALDVLLRELVQRPLLRALRDLWPRASIWPADAGEHVGR